MAEDRANKLKHVLIAARKTHTPQDYKRLSAPILLELQQRGREILEYLSIAQRQTVAS